MKKKYITPETSVITIKASQLLTGSNLPIGGTSDQQLAPEYDFDFENE